MANTRTTMMRIATPMVASSTAFAASSNMDGNLC
jgi:hypothetical protein